MSGKEILVGDQLSGSSRRPLVAAVILGILFVVALALAIAFGVLWNNERNSANSCENATSKLKLEGARITANRTSITGSWDNTGNREDVVQLYVSENPFKYDDNGIIIVTEGVSTQANQAQDTSNSGNNANSVTVSGNISPGRAYNAAMIVSNSSTPSTVTFGPITVFTQDGSDLLQSRKLFNIRDLDNCAGKVTPAGGYSVETSSSGIFRLGFQTGNGAQAQGNGFLVKYENNEPDQNTEPVEILCRSETSNDVVFGFWANPLSSSMPVICPTAESINGEACSEGTTAIANSRCRWDYNTTQAAGQNKWCLSTPQVKNMITSETEVLCLSSSGGGGLSLSTVSDANRWYNECTGAFGSINNV